MTLYSYWRSTTAYRVRIALNLKNVPYDIRPIDLTRGDQSSTDYLSLNPIAGVPTLELDDGTVLTQSVAILEYLECAYPSPSLLPQDPIQAAQVRAAAMLVATDIHPINNLKVTKALKELGHSETEVIEWMGLWMTRGLSAYAALLRDDTVFSFTEKPSLADLCLVPQLYNARRWKVDLTPFSRLTDIEKRCLALPAFERAHPSAQPDAK